MFMQILRSLSRRHAVKIVCFFSHKIMLFWVDNVSPFCYTSIIKKTKGALNVYYGKSKVCGLWGIRW